jgi:glycosyltransferase involved in cell wall biosynthesis
MIRSLQIIDTLRIGGSERMAINIANGLSNKNVESHICATRYEGQLKAELKSEVFYLFLNKKSVFDFKALLRLKKYIKKKEINVVHAHGTSFFLAVLVSFFVWDLKIIWHDHYGNRVNDANKFKLELLKLCSFKFHMIYTVNHELKDWAINNLHCKNVKFIPNFPIISSKKETKLIGALGKRILCLANLREPKNHKLLFEAFKRINKNYKDWTLHCVGTIFNDNYSKELKVFITENDLENHIFLYNAKEDVSHIISQVDIGILTSSSEGLPMSLLEYGLGGLPVITTDVGYCRNLISDKSYGITVPSQDTEAIVTGLRMYINNANYRNSCAKNFHKRVVENFLEAEVLGTIINDYTSQNVLSI